MNNLSPLLSIIIPVYNTEKYIGQCIDSIIQNDISNVEIIIIDDGSTDKSLKIIKKYANRYHQINVYKEKNKGVSVARNKGLQYSKGKWIWFLDSDDTIFPDALRYIKNEISRFDFDILIFGFCQYENKIVDLKDSAAINKFQAMESLLQPRYASYPWNKIIKKKLINNTIVFPVNMIYTEDLATMYKIYERAEKIRISSSQLYFYRSKEECYSTSLTPKQIKDAAQSHIDIYNFFYNNYPDLASKIKNETLVCILSYFHTLNHKQVKENTSMIDIVLNNINISKLNLRYKIEVFSFKYCFPLFKLIGLIGHLKKKVS